MARDGSEWARFSVDYGFYSALMSGSIDGTDTRAHDRGVIRAMSTQCMLILLTCIWQFVFTRWMAVLNLSTDCLFSSILLDKPNKHVTGDPERTLFVARLSHNTSEG